MSKLETNSIKDLVGISRKCHHTELLVSLSIHNTESRYRIDKLEFYKRLKTNAFTEKLVKEYEKLDEVKTSDSYFVTQIKALTREAPDNRIIRYSKTLGINYPPAGSWDIAYGEKANDINDKCDFVIEKLKTDLPTGHDTNLSKRISDCLSDKCSYKSTKMLSDILLPESIKNWMNSANWIIN